MSLEEELAQFQREALAAQQAGRLNIAAPVRLLVELFRRAEQREALLITDQEDVNLAALNRECES